MTVWKVRALDALLWAQGAIEDSDLCLSWPAPGEAWAWFFVRADRRADLLAFRRILANDPVQVCWNESAPGITKPGRFLGVGSRRYASAGQAREWAGC